MSPNLWFLIVDGALDELDGSLDAEHVPRDRAGCASQGDPANEAANRKPHEPEAVDKKPRQKTEGIDQVPNVEECSLEVFDGILRLCVVPEAAGHHSAHHDQKTSECPTFREGLAEDVRGKHCIPDHIQTSKWRNEGLWGEAIRCHVNHGAQDCVDDQPTVKKEPRRPGRSGLLQLREPDALFPYRAGQRGDDFEAHADVPEARHLGPLAPSPYQAAAGRRRHRPNTLRRTPGSNGGQRPRQAAA
mmetsp:Transcript_114476/g.287651  ORF Transcript_114476/g.287651 Transcript_114476/m.287651 type:complete len:245 (+) Transcript_114476:1279-2013(+)